MKDGIIGCDLYNRQIILIFNSMNIIRRPPSAKRIFIFST